MKEKKVRDSRLKEMSVLTIEAKKSNLSIGETAGTPPSFSCLFCRFSLAGSCFDDLVT